VYHKKVIKDQIILEWNREWANYPHCRQTKLFFPEINLCKSKRVYQTDSVTYSMTVRWITGHNGLLYHNNKISPQVFPQADCRMCGEEDETAAHIIGECPLYDDIRAECFETRSILEHELKKLPIAKIHKFVSFRDVLKLELTDDLLPVVDHFYEMRSPTLEPLEGTDNGTDLSPRSI
jgi:hypothetical protein